MKKAMIFLLAISLYGCGEENKKPQIRLSEYNHSDAYKSVEEMKVGEIAVAAAAAENAPDPTVFEISLEATDKMTFNTDELKVPANSMVKLTLIHVGKLPANVMGHNFVLLRKGTDVATFGLKATEFADNDYIPTDTKAVIAHTKIIGGGESTSIEFKAPRPGTYTFICSFPGHYMMMKGTFVVE